MRLPEEDEEYLNKKGYRWELLQDSATVPPGGLLIIHDYPISSTIYNRDKCELMIRIPAGYNIAALDMFYVDPEIRLNTGAYPDQADQFETHGERRWQRFSRHFINITWRAGVDTIRTMLSFVDRELKGHGQ